jgi:ArsR family transcriptional regulator
MYESKAAFFRVLASYWRLRILDELRAGPVSVRDLRLHLGVEQATLSQHLAILRAHDLVQTERRGTVVMYEISHPAVWEILDAARLLFDSQLGALQTALKTLGTRA